MTIAALALTTRCVIQVANPQSTPGFTMDNSILVLPVELLREIIEWAICPPKKARLQTLCTVNRVFSAIVQPMMLSNLKLGIDSNGHQDRNRQVQILALGAHPACQLATTMTLWMSSETGSPLNISGQRTLKRAITNCSRLEKIIWNLGPGEPPWVQNEVLSALYHLSSLKTLHIHVKPSYLYRLRLSTGSNLSTLTSLRIEYLSLGYFENEAARQSSGRNLSQLISRCPNLVSLEVAFPGLDLTDIFPGVRSGDLSRVPPIRHLSLFGIGKIALLRDIPNIQSLGIRLDPDADGAFTGIWNILRLRNTFPSRIMTDRSLYESDLLNYLYFHPYLESLILLPVNPNYIPDALVEHHALARLCDILTRHSQHLIEFVLRPSPSWCPPHWDWTWVEASMKPALFACRKLQRLGFRIPQSDINRMREALHELLSISGEAFDNLQELHIYFESDVPTSHPLAPRPFMHLASNNQSEQLKMDVDQAMLAYEVDDWRKYNYEVHVHQRIWTVRFGESRFTRTYP